MSPYQQVFMLVILVSGFASCDRLNDLEEGDRNTFTWKGQLVKDCNGQPIKSTKIWLEASFSGVPDDDFEILGETITDQNGNFSLTYKKIRKISAYDVALYMPEGSFTDKLLLNAPVNEDVYRDIAQNDCHILTMNVTCNANEVDSVYLAVGKVYDKDQTFILKLDEVDSTYQFRILGLPLMGGFATRTIKRANQLAPSWNNEPNQFIMGYGKTIAEVKRSLLSVYLDSIPSGYNQIEFPSRGFPYTDEVEILIE